MNDPVAARVFLMRYETDAKMLKDCIDSLKSNYGNIDTLAEKIEELGKKADELSNAISEFKKAYAIE
jgi:hydroxyethylthiazole kinase-like sugar kinase family protein